MTKHSKSVSTLVDDLTRVKKRITSLYAAGDNMTEADLIEFRTQFFSSKAATTLLGSIIEPR